MNSFANLLPQLRLPVFGSPMFIASGPDLVKAQCQAGIIGSFPTLNARPASMLTDWLDEIRESNAAFTTANPDRPAAPFAVNLIVHRSNNRLEADLAEVVRHQVPIVITSLGAREEVNEAVHSYGGIVLHDVINNKFAHKAVEKGADGVIAVAAGAGGHAGALSPFALVQEIRTWFDGPLLLSGAIAHGRSVLASLAAGADCAYVGSAFLSTAEANVAEDYKQMVVDSAAEDVVYSSYFTGVKGNYLRGSITASGLDPDNLPDADPTKMDFGTKEGSDSKAWKDIWGSGQGIGVLGTKRTTAELVESLAAEFEAAKKDLAARN
ncbi:MULTISPECIES: nitronate monooxygenase family protein [Brevibacterium]|uniref:Nitronate monooxygenase n=2 Tax=Brevibacterium antiquum TaxID=234835 RepID=A0A2H1KXZ6_9MICO|nr:MULTISPECIES: nitronate monooxygenase family protein [Brevibacterium]SMX97254.1 nitronate monooxygenase [Brevibacterium antiquum]SMY04444.1 nitronate monooxygenase [Brevibacterium antiquum CNRZ 918]HCG57166.1 nitronate monooxygenase [Brevibacterium sp.]